MGASDFWNIQEHAQSVVQQVKALKNWVDPFESLVARVQSARELSADHLPAVATIIAAEKFVGGKVETRMRVRTDNER